MSIQIAAPGTTVLREQRYSLSTSSGGINKQSRQILFMLRVHTGNDLIPVTYCTVCTVQYAQSHSG